MSSSTLIESSPSKDYYHFRVPIESCIYPRPSPEETLSTLANVNNSLSPVKRLPVEILLLINDEVHTVDPAYAKLRSKWTPSLQHVDPIVWGEGKLCIRYFQDEKTVLVEEAYSGRRTDDEICFLFVASSADFLYRVRCLFPEVLIHSKGTGTYKRIWTAGLRHNQSGVMLILTEEEGWVEVLKGDDEVGKVFIEDTLLLMNMLFGTVDGKRFTYYHPGAYADLPTPDQRFLAVPGPSHDTCNDIRGPYDPWWNFFPLPMEDLTSGTFKSILSRLKYDSKSRRVDLENGTANLTTIISSSLLFYRLLCQWTMDSINVNDEHYPITSVWQFELQHKKHAVALLFVDDRGLFDIKVEGDENRVMGDIVALVDALCSDDWTHPDDVYVVPGSFR